MTHLVLHDVTKEFAGTTVVDGVDLEIADGEAVVLLGPSGCGKTTCLRMIAGFERPERGRIVLGERVLVDGSCFVPPERRHLSVVFQSYALWPHMTVAQNVGYGPTTAKAKRAEVSRRVEEALDLVHLGGMGSRYVHQLSGGQQQRVALARALVNEPSLLLLDEPLSNLDTRLREEMRGEIRRIQQSLRMTMVYVTHDQAEALSLADRVVVMNSGRIAQIGTPEEVYRRPCSSYVARALGSTNILPAVVADEHLRLPGGLETPLSDARVAARDVTVSIRPADIRVAACHSDERAHGAVAEALFFGDVVSYRIEIDGHAEHIRATGPGARRLEVGTSVRLDVEPSAVAVLHTVQAASTALLDRPDPVQPAPAAVPA